jgi:hypothetical protein
MVHYYYLYTPFPVKRKPKMINAKFYIQLYRYSSCLIFLNGSIERVEKDAKKFKSSWGNRERKNEMDGAMLFWDPYQ